ncbi:MAG: DUF3489 domain-containing protein [Hyphomicrobiales bacterium]|nr:DUF3489 domain-containing protein [Hyphomicrobiales bacterium]
MTRSNSLNRAKTSPKRHSLQTDDPAQNDPRRRKSTPTKKPTTKPLKSRPIPAAAGRGSAVVSTKKQDFVRLLERAEGATIAELRMASGWQAHSVRGFVSGELRKRMGLQVITELGDDGARRYRINTVSAR